MDVEEEVIELRQEVEDLRHSFGPLARTEARNDELRALLVVLLGKVERLAAREVQDSQSLQSRQKEAATRQKDHTAPTAEHPSLAPYSPLSGKEAPPVFPTEAATRDMAQMRQACGGRDAGDAAADDDEVGHASSSLSVAGAGLGERALMRA